MTADMHTFLGANTENGFFALYDELIKNSKVSYVIKGGPGTGKSTLMQKIACLAKNKGYSVEYIHCSSDPDSLDGIYIPDKSLCVVDGTSPHTVEPVFPGASGRLINLYEFFDNNFLSNHIADIRKLNQEISILYERAYLYLGATGKLQRDINKIGLLLTNKAKLKGYFERLIAKNVKYSEGISIEHKRFLSAISPKGFITYSDILNDPQYKTLVIDDEYGISAYALELLRHKAIKLGHKFYSFYNPLNPTVIEHILLPQAGLCVCTSNSLHHIEPKPYCRINISRFFISEAEKAHREKINFLKRARDEIMKESIKLFDECHKKHISLEEIYKISVDFEKLNNYTESILTSILE